MLCPALLFGAFAAFLQTSDEQYVASSGGALCTGEALAGPGLPVGTAVLVKAGQGPLAAINDKQAHIVAEDVVGHQYTVVVENAGSSPLQASVAAASLEAPGGVWAASPHPSWLLLEGAEAEALAGTEPEVTEAARTFNELGKKPAKVMEALQKLGAVPAADPASMAAFLMGPGLDLKMVGEFLGGKEDVCKETLAAFAKLFDFGGLGLVEALRTFLSTFRLPGEAQMVDRVASHFSKAYWSDMPEGAEGTRVVPRDGGAGQSTVLHSSSSVMHVLTFSTFMLNTDLHNPGVRDKMTFEQFKSNNRGIDGGRDIDELYLKAIYRTIETDPLKLPNLEMAKYVDTDAYALPAAFRLPPRSDVRGRLYLRNAAGTLFLYKDERETWALTDSLRDVFAGAGGRAHRAEPDREAFVIRAKGGRAEGDVQVPRLLAQLAGAWAVGAAGFQQAQLRVSVGAWTLVHAPGKLGQTRKDSVLFSPDAPCDRGVLDGRLCFTGQCSAEKGPCFLYQESGGEWKVANKAASVQNGRAKLRTTTSLGLADLATAQWEAACTGGKGCKGGWVACPDCQFVQPGAHVRLSGQKSADLNGKQGHVLDCSEATGSCTVQVENVQPMPMRLGGIKPGSFTLLKPEPMAPGL